MRWLPVIVCVLGAAQVAQGRVRWQTPGGYRLRATALSDAPLDAEGTRSEQAWLAMHRLRIRPSIEIGEVDIRLELDVLAGQIAGDPNPVGARFAERRQGDQNDPRRGWTTVDPRQAWVRWSGERGAVVFGQMGAAWGVGLLDSDGRDRDPGPWVARFDDRWYGDLVDRLMIQGRPFWPWTTGPLANLTFSLGGDHVWQDERASFLEGDTAWRAFGAVEWLGEGVKLGLLGMHRWQTDVDGAEASLTFLDLYGVWDVPLYMIGAELKLSGEAVFTVGETARRATVSSPGGVDRLALGWLARVDLAWRCPRVAFALEAGYASGDADPADEADRAFTFDPDHRVGFVLFPDVLRLLTLRGADRMADGSRVGRAPPGLEDLPTDGAVRNALYLFPGMTWRPGAWRLTLAGVLAWAAVPWLDPYATFEAGGVARNAFGRPAARFYGGELALAAEHQWRLQGVGSLAVGAQLGGFVAGAALAGALADDPVAKGMLRVDLRW